MGNLLNMSTLTLNNVALYTESDEIAEWLRSTLSLTELAVNNTYRCYKASQLTDKPLSLIIVTEEKFKLLYTFLKKTNRQLPILVVTKEFGGFSIPKNSKLTIDTLPLPAITIGLFEHGIKAVIQDFRLNQKLTNLAHYDSLTGAANRLLFRDRLSQALKAAKRNKRAVSLLYFDLDDFKPINDNFGHDIGDELLKCFVKIISSLVRDVDTLARIGGDEFVLLLTDTPLLELKNMCNKIVNVLSNEQQVGEHLIEIKSSIGAVATSVENGLLMTPDALLKKADLAVYQAKKVKGTHFVIS